MDERTASAGSSPVVDLDGEPLVYNSEEASRPFSVSCTASRHSSA